MTRTLPVGPGASSEQEFDFALVKDGRGGQTRQVRDADRVVWVDECADMVAASTTDPAALTCGAYDSTFYTYEATGEVATIYDAMAGPGYDDPKHELAYHYDTAGQILQVVDPDGGTSTTTYDLRGNVHTVTNGRGQLTTYDFDALDRLAGIGRPDGEKDVTIAYDDSGPGHTRRRASVTEVGGYSSSHEYDVK